MDAVKALENFYAQLEVDKELALDLERYDGIVVCGMGGSGVVGDIASSWAAHRGYSIPVISHKGYGLPPYVKKDYLVVCISYSGNTQETLSSFKEALAKGIRPVCISSGGRLRQVAEENDCPYVEVPEGFAPRFALGFMLSRLLSLLGIDEYEMEDARENLKESSAEVKERAFQLAQRLYGYIPVIYSTPLTAAAATRWKAEINENAKSPCYGAILPEMHHNEIVGLGNPLTREKFVFVLMEDAKDGHEIKERVKITEDILKRYGTNPIRVSAGGNSYISRLLKLIHLGDWLSLYLSEIYGYDPMPVEVIDFIKRKLSE